MGQWARYVVQLLSLVVLARLLSPDDFGVIGMVAVAVALGELVRDAGLTNGAIQRSEITRAEQSTLFYLNVGFGSLVAVIIAALAFPFASFYDVDEVAPVMLVMATIPIVSGLAAQHLVDLTRAFKFGRIATADVAGSIAGTSGAIVAAALGAGVWALVILNLGQAIVRTAVLMTGSSLRPGRPAPLREVAGVLRFGRNLFFVQLLDYASRNVDNLVIGRTAGAASLGLYTRAYQLLLLPLQQINAPLTRVALPVLSRLKDTPDRFLHYLRVVTIAVSYLGVTVLTVCVVAAPEMIDVALGPKWGGAVDLFRALAVAGIFQAVGYVAYWLFMSLDRTGVHVRYALIAKPAVVVGFIVGAHFGDALGVALAYSIVTALTVPLSIVMACRGTFVPTTFVLSIVGRAATLGILLSGGLWASRDDAFGIGGWLTLAGTLVLVACIVLHPGYRRDLAGLRDVKNLVRRKPALASA
jgi:PST family polysaccharide transporter